MLALRPFRAADREEIRSWPPYPPAFAELDYALRDGGWIDEYGSRPGTDVFIAADGDAIVGFSLLEREPGEAAEFRIAVHPEQLGQGLGRRIALLTLARGFSDPAIGTIRLIVRKNNPRAERLYQSLGFRRTGECMRDVHGKPVAFYCMAISREQFRQENPS